MTDIIDYNIRHALSQKKEDEDTAILAQLQPDYMTFQEIASKENYHSLFNNITPYGYSLVPIAKYEKRHNGVHKTPIAFNAIHRALVDYGANFLTGPISDEGAGGGTAVDKTATWAVFREKESFRKEIIVNWHAPASISVPERSKEHREAVKNLTTLVLELRRKYRCRVFICGDTNTNFKNPRHRSRYKDLLSNGFAVNWGFFDDDTPSFPQHNGQIDWIISNMVPQKQEVLLDFHSDHRPIRVWY